MKKKIVTKNVLITQPTSPQLPILQSSWTESSSPPTLNDDTNVFLRSEHSKKEWQPFDIHRWNELLHHHRSSNRIVRSPSSSRWVGRSFSTGTLTRHGEIISSLPPLARAQSTTAAAAASSEAKHANATTNNGSRVSNQKSIKQGLDPTSLRALATLAERHARSNPKGEQRHYHFQPLPPLLEPLSSSSNDATASTITEDDDDDEEEEESTPLLSYVQLHRTFPEKHPPHNQTKDANDLFEARIKSRFSHEQNHSSTPNQKHVVFGCCRWMFLLFGSFLYGSSTIHFGIEFNCCQSITLHRTTTKTHGGSSRWDTTLEPIDWCYHPQCA